MRAFKIVQKRLYDALSHRHAVLLCFVGFVLIIMSAFHFGETAMEWSSEKYQAVFNSYRDNLAQKSFQKLMCQYVPIDAVYTWVNGSDPKLISDLFKVRHQMAQELNISTIRDAQCTYSHCVASHLVLVQPLLPRWVTFADLWESDPFIANITSIFTIQAIKKEKLQNFSVLVFDSTDSAKVAGVQGSFLFHHINYSMTVAYLTDEWMAHSAVLLEDVYVISGVPPGHNQDDFQKKLPRAVQKVFLFPEKSTIVVSVKSSEITTNFTSMKLTLDKKYLKILPAYLVVEPLSADEDASASRFADNEELRYSLRSLEKNAPWIRHVYLVTNGQIPSWLNMDSPRITIITHEELFPNSSHLPTFSSPAIECHLHRIPGLSDKFLYLNDDVFLGKEVWPEDFYSHSKGHKVYLSWPVPDCAEGCPTSWIRDGYCDRTCNNSGCDWDGGDCAGTNVKFSYPQVNVPNRGNFMFANQLIEDMNKLYCNPNCANSWLADRYCDQACNVRSCGFDAGDCGTTNFQNLHSISLRSGIDRYQLPPGEMSAYLNLSMLFPGNASVQSGSYEEHDAVRVIAVSLKYSVLVVVLKISQKSSNVSIILKSPEKEVAFTLGIDTREDHITTTTLEPDSPVPEMVSPDITVPVPSPDITIYPQDQWFPKILLDGDEEGQGEINFNASSAEMAPEKLKHLDDLKALYENGLLTEKGYRLRRNKALMGDTNHAKNPVRDDIQLNLVHIDEVISVPSTIRRGLRWVTDGNENFQSRPGSMPWEKNGFFDELHKMQLSRKRQSQYSLKESYHTRHLLDTFGDSLRRVNRLYNSAFGYEARKVPAHMAHLVDVNIMNRLQGRFMSAFNATSSHKVRSAEDMQFSFSYYYYLISEMEDVPIEDIFDQFDTDRSGTWSDREIRTLLTRINDLPLHYANVAEFEQQLTNCSGHLGMSNEGTQPPDERYVDSTLPLVSKDLVTGCDPVRSKLLDRFGKRRRNQFELLGEEEVTFKMLHSNLSIVLSLLDEIRKTPKKFICLNDNIGHGTKEADVIKAVLRDFYESLFPTASQFELPADYRNRFLYMDDLRRWQKSRFLVRTAALLLIISFLIPAIITICSPERFLRRGRTRSAIARIDV